MKKICIRGANPIMTFTKEEIDIIVPKLAEPISEAQYLRMPKFDNNNKTEYLSMMGYDPEEAEELQIFLRGIEMI